MLAPAWVTWLPPCATVSLRRLAWPETRPRNKCHAYLDTGCCAQNQRYHHCCFPSEICPQHNHISPCSRKNTCDKASKLTMCARLKNARQTRSRNPVATSDISESHRIIRLHSFSFLVTIESISSNFCCLYGNIMPSHSLVSYSE